MNEPKPSLRRGWTTGACATAAAKAAYVALVSGDFPDPVEITLPSGRTVSFPLAEKFLGDAYASAGVIKDAGDDPDVTHGATVCAKLRRGLPGTSVGFHAGPGVGTVTKPGLPIAVGEPAINPVPRTMMRETIAFVAKQLGDSADVQIEISIPGGEELAKRTMNPRLGIVGGLSILGTTGIVIPYSCSAWIASIHEGIDIARALGLKHVAGSTGSTSEAAVTQFHGLSESALIDMGDFAGGMLKYLRRKPVPRVTISGGFAKISKLAQGSLDLHSQRSRLDLAQLASLVCELGGSQKLRAEIAAANTGLHAFQLAQAADIPLAQAVAVRARIIALAVLRDAPISLDVLVVDRDGSPIAHAE
ncbi:MAG TPA: cobalt-precorrin-5B (C(1))-methyltransferase [Candidatus Baltobacteraceae bacterium]|nr:cobalt-precorrin-5B (C(1))-methyltransferase [Candidatus Baltobacteraceae bacterium]